MRSVSRVAWCVGGVSLALTGLMLVFLSTLLLRPSLLGFPSLDDDTRAVIVRTRDLRHEQPQVYRALFPHDPTTLLGLPFEDVTFPSFDGRVFSVLRGWWVPYEGATRAIVAVHGAGNNRAEFLRQTACFHAEGFSVLLVDLRSGLGASVTRGVEDYRLGYGYREQWDVSAAVTYAIEERGMEEVVLVGMSAGASASILAASRDHRVGAVIAESPFTSVTDVWRHNLIRILRGGRSGEFASLGRVGRWLRPLSPFLFSDRFLDLVVALAVWRLDPNGPAPVDVVPRLAPRPLYLIHHRDDPLVPVENSRVLLAKGSGFTKLVELDGDMHVCAITTLGKDGYAALVTPWLRAL